MAPKNILLPFVISICFIFFTGCEKEAPEIEKKQEIIISVNYKSRINSETGKDIGSKIYIYYGLLQTDLLHYKQNESKDGIIYHVRDNSNVITPDSIGEVDINGIFSFIPDTGIEKILFQVESNYFKDKGDRLFFSKDLSYYQGRYMHTITFTH